MEDLFVVEMFKSLRKAEIGQSVNRILKTTQKKVSLLINKCKLSLHIFLLEIREGEVVGTWDGGQIEYSNIIKMGL